MADPAIRKNLKDLGDWGCHNVTVRIQSVVCAETLWFAVSKKGTGTQVMVRVHCLLRMHSRAFVTKKERRRKEEKKGGREEGRKKGKKGVSERKRKRPIDRSCSGL